MIVVPGCGWQATKSSVGGAAVDRVSVSIAVHNRERCDGQKRFGKLLEQKTASGFALPQLTLGIGRELGLRPTNSLA
jgi:hypothetical protein